MARGPSRDGSPIRGQVWSKGRSWTATRIHAGERFIEFFEIEAAHVAVARCVLPAVPAVDGVKLVEVRTGTEIIETLTHGASDFEIGSSRLENRPQVTGFAHEKPEAAIGCAAEQFRAAHRHLSRPARGYP